MVEMFHVDVAVGGFLYEQFYGTTATLGSLYLTHGRNWTVGGLFKDENSLVVEMVQIIP